MVTFYCGAPFEGRAIQKSSKFTFRKNRGPYYLQWEHVVPAHAFGQAFPEWRDGDSQCRENNGAVFRGRKCARNTNLLFRFMESDMYNLVPAIDEVNRKRSNYSFAELVGNSTFGPCKMKIIGRKAEPPDEVKGDVARIYLYMEQAYPGKGIISNKNEKLFVRWDAADPVDAWECKRYRRIRELQGNDNPILRDRCK